MEKYLGVKLIEAEPMILNDAAKALNKSNSAIVNKDNPDVNASGYKVIYEGGYTSWSPKDVFEKACRKIDGLTFGLAIEALKQGKRVARKGWNGNGLFIFKQIPANIGLDIIPKMQSVPQSTKDEMIERKQHLNYRNQCVIVDLDGNVDNWNPSISDCFAEDWMILD